VDMSDQVREKNKETRTLPPGQRAIRKLLRWGIDHPAIVKTIPRLDVTTWRLVIDGEVEKPLRLDWQALLKLPKVKSVSDFHCVEGWSVRDCRWEGVRFQTLAQKVQPRDGAAFVFFECADGYTTSLALPDLLDDDVVLAYRLNGQALEASLGGPLRLVLPKKYAYKSAMWITRIRFLATKLLGYWEKRGYSDSANVWTNDRFRT
jgi:DMSO/TMAO reductase YedYZ molybdopterin-dependent catalytic subunit